MEFKDMGLRKEILKSIEKMGYVEPTEIQEKMFPIINNGDDCIGESWTGSGKTLAFSLPILNNIIENKKTQVLILAPTRELAIQIASDMEKLAEFVNISIASVYGSSSIENQIRKIRKGTEIIVGTPGRVKDLLNRSVINLNNIKYFVLDESDEMLSMGFQEELEDIFKFINVKKQVLLFSATMPIQIQNIASKYMNKDYKKINIITQKKASSNIEQNYYIVKDKTRLESLCRIMDFYNSKRAIIFCKTKKNVDELYEKLLAKGYNVSIIHGDISQEQRIKTLDKFKKGLFNYLIATDVAARGIHVEGIDIVFNYNLPETFEYYVHRIGRTGRVNSKGISATFIKTSEEKKLESLEKYIKQEIIKKKIPTKDEILDNILKESVENLNNIKNNDYKNSSFKEEIDILNEYELKNIVNYYLNKEKDLLLGSDFTVDINKKEKTKKNNKNRNLMLGYIRIFINVGLIDDLNKKELLDFLEKKSHLKDGTFKGTEILSKFTFMNVPEKDYDKLIKSCNNIRYKGRTMRIEKAN